MFQRITRLNYTTGSSLLDVNQQFLTPRPTGTKRQTAQNPPRSKAALFSGATLSTTSFDLLEAHSPVNAFFVRLHCEVTISINSEVRYNTVAPNLPKEM